MIPKNVVVICLEKIGVAASILSLVITLLLRCANPLFYLPNRDSGYYLYGGRFIASGGLFYQNLWAERPPAMYYLNAFGIWLGRDTRWGVWLVELLFLSLAAWLGYRLLQKLWQPGAAVFGTLLWIWGISRIMVTGNLVEEYPILFAFLALTFFVRSIDHPHRHLDDVLIGVLAALSFLFRANTIGVELSIALTWLAWGLLTHHILDTLKRLFVMLLGALIPILLVVLYFAWLGTLSDMIIASVLYSLFYIGEHSNPLNNLSGGFIYVGIPAWITLVGWIAALVALLPAIKEKKTTPLALLLALIWPVEVILSGLSARAYEHYFVSWAPALAVTCGFLYHQLVQWKASAKMTALINRYAVFILTAVTLMILFFNRATVLEYRRPLLNWLTADSSPCEKTDRLTQYIDTFTATNDQVLLWGGQAVYNYLSHRSTPTAYPWYPTYVASPFTSSMNDRFLADLKRQKPELIIDAYIDSPLDVPSINDDMRHKQTSAGIYLLAQNAATPNLPQVLDFIRANYNFETTVDQHDIYRLKGSKWKDKVPPPYSW